eukprot:TRINITY_DN7894_c0_g1_i1.p1 TRINITY_DN7894_c0_g1~~TRINITY_DN7894_c0_g1_i1.p1  ORF type:complete len:270 (-),score=42.13 TRINITY_DN7894_c0_g1_i1:167-976(-)
MDEDFESTPGAHSKWRLNIAICLALIRYLMQMFLTTLGCIIFFLPFFIPSYSCSCSCSAAVPSRPCHYRSDDDVSELDCALSPFVRATYIFIGEFLNVFHLFLSLFAACLFRHSTAPLSTFLQWRARPLFAFVLLAFRLVLILLCCCLLILVDIPGLCSCDTVCTAQHRPISPTFDPETTSVVRVMRAFWLVYLLTTVVHLALRMVIQKVVGRDSLEPCPTLFRLVDIDEVGTWMPRDSKSFATSFDGERRDTIEDDMSRFQKLDDSEH